MEKINNQNQIGQFIVNYNQQMKDILDQSQRQIGSMLQQMDYTKVINKLIETVDEVIEDNAKLKRYVFENQEKNKELERKLDETKDNLEKVNDIVFTYTLVQDDEKLLDLRKAIQSRIFHFTSGDKTDCRYILFYASFSKKCTKNLHDHFGVTKYSKIKIKDFDYAISFVNSWRPRGVDKIIKEYQKKQSKINPKTKKSMLSNKQEIALNEYLNRTKGGMERFV